jgi:hypothetical protein
MRSQPRWVLRRFVARPLTGMFLVVPLLAAVLDLGNASILLTLSGAAAIYLALDLFLSRIGRPVAAELGSHLNLVAWTAGIAALAAAGWPEPAWQYNGELVTLVGMATGFAIGMGSPRGVAALWTVAAGAAVALGASLTGPLTAEPAMVVAAIAIGTWFGAVVGLVVEALAAPHRSLVRAAAPTSAASAPVSAQVSGERSTGPVPGSPPN